MPVLVFGKNLDGVDDGVVDHGHDGALNSASGTGLDVIEGLDDKRGAAGGEYVKVLQQHFAIAGHIKHTASGTAGSPILCAKPGLAKLESDAVMSQRDRGDDIAETANALRFV